jgi:hypothetical protein
MHDIIGFSSVHKNSAAVDERADLAALSATICKEHEAAALSLSYALEHAMACGDALLKAKPAAGPHGTWLAWLKRLELQGGPSARMAQNYMRLAENRAMLAAAANTKQRFALGTVRGALALIRHPRPSLATPRSKSPSSAGKAPKLTRHDVLAWFGTAPVVEHQHLFDSLGSRVVAAAIPPHWNMRLACAEESVGQITAQQRDATIRSLNWKAATTEQRTAHLARIPICELLAALSREQRLEIEARIDGLRAAQAKPIAAATHH